jgi:hypothetical protein
MLGSWQSHVDVNDTRVLTTSFVEFLSKCDARSASDDPLRNVGDKRGRPLL